MFSKLESMATNDGKAIVLVYVITCVLLKQYYYDPLEILFSVPFLVLVMSMYEIATLYNF